MRGPRALARGAVAVLAGAAGILGQWPGAARATTAKEPFSFLATPTDQLGVPGLFAASEVTPEGDLYTGYGELAFELGSPLAPYDQPLRSFEGGRFPIIDSTVEHAGVSYSVAMLATPVGGVSVDLVRVVMRNVSGRPQTAVWAAGMRRSGGARLTADGAPDFRYLAPSGTENGLYAQPGAVLPPSRTWRVAGDAIVSGGRSYAFLPASRAGRTSRNRRTCADRVEICALVSYARRLGPGQEAVLDFAMPAVPVALPGALAARIANLRYPRAHADLRAAWAKSLAPAIRIHLPEQAVENAYYASLTQILTSRYKLPANAPGGIGGFWVQAVNDLQYHAFWLRDGAIMTNALDLAGLHAVAAQDLAYFPVWRAPDGLYESRLGQFDGMGEALWAIGRHAELTGDDAFARAEFPGLAQSVRWIAQQVASDPLGLMPISSPGDNEQITGHLAGDDFWAVAGMDAAVRLAAMAGSPPAAAGWPALDAELRANVARATRAAAAGNGGAVPPALDRTGGLDWGNWWVAYPDGPFSIYDPIVTATIARADAGMREGIATYDHGRMLHDYLGFRIFETQLERGEQAPVVDGLYSEIAHSTGTSGGFETGIAPLGKRSSASNLSPHGTYSGELVTLIRNMLVRDDGTRIYLLSAVPGGWLEPGAVTSATRAPTTLGPVSFRLSAHPGGATLTWSAPASIDPVWPVPNGVGDFHASAGTLSGRSLTLPASSGTLRVTWKLHGSTTTLAGTIASLRREYRSHGRPFPAGSAGRRPSS
ncbi:MAG TPA: hypothetical protein VHW26_05930 [Solirubrobacteraceae bacterium]|jgi:hypothetical protein|nr:hypothetical protein [Solirubrobacteraceae bacterium]